MNYGTYVRTKPRMNIKRGYTGNEPQSLTRSAQPLAGEDIKSGMLIVLINGKWVKCDSDTSAHVGLTPFFALQDQTDTDVVASGLLTGLSCLGDFEIQTGYYVTGTTTWNEGDLVVKSGTAGLIDRLAQNSTCTREVIGVVSQGGIEDIAGICSEAAKDGNGKIYVINLTTYWKPASA